MIIKAIKKNIEISKAGNPYTRVILQFDEYKDGKGNRRWITGFGNKKTWGWKVGDDVDPTVIEEGQYLNFKYEDTDENRLNVYELPATIGFVMDLLKGKPDRPAETVQEDVINTDDIPF